jgi:hypothetical protein
LLEDLRRRRLERRFDIEGSAEFIPMLRGQANGEIDSWAVRWYASVTLVGGLCLHPRKSLVRNNGWDATGSNCGVMDKYDTEPAALVLTRFPREVVEDRTVVRAMRRFRLPPIQALRKNVRRVGWALDKIARRLLRAVRPKDHRPR